MYWRQGMGHVSSGKDEDWMKLVDGQYELDPVQ
jgi:hypothetical protein